MNNANWPQCKFIGQNWCVFEWVALTQFFWSPPCPSKIKSTLRGLQKLRFSLLWLILHNSCDPGERPNKDDSTVEVSLTMHIFLENFTWNNAVVWNNVFSKTLTALVRVCYRLGWPIHLSELITGGNISVTNTQTTAISCPPLSSLVSSTVYFISRQLWWVFAIRNHLCLSLGIYLSSAAFISM